MLPEDINDERLSRRLQTAGLDIPPLSRYAIGPIRPGLLFGLAAFDIKQIREGVGRMARVFAAISH
jgi:DNA-binding transcriptional MocR family regulator